VHVDHAQWKTSDNPDRHVHSGDVATDCDIQYIESCKAEGAGEGGRGGEDLSGMKWPKDATTPISKPV
jgi:hypothetical protein